jgi:hypothetical protein
LLERPLDPKTVPRVAAEEDYGVDSEVDVCVFVDQKVGKFGPGELIEGVGRGSKWAASFLVSRGAKQDMELV